MKKAFLITISALYFLTSFFVLPAFANSAPDLKYTIDKNEVPSNLLPYLGVFEGKWRNGPDYKLAIIKFNVFEKTATIIYSWGKWTTGGSGQKSQKARFDSKGKKLHFYSEDGWSYSFKLKEKKGKPEIKGTMDNGSFRSSITLCWSDNQ